LVPRSPRDYDPPSIFSREADVVERIGFSRFPVVLATVVLAATLLASCARDVRPRAAREAGRAEESAADINTGDRLVTGKSIDPDSARSAQDVGSLPVNMVLAPGGAFAVTTDQGYRQALWSLGTRDGAGADFHSRSGRHWIIPAVRCRTMRQCAPRRWRANCAAAQDARAARPGRQ